MVGNTTGRLGYPRGDLGTSLSGVALEVDAVRGDGGGVGEEGKAAFAGGPEVVMGGGLAADRIASALERPGRSAGATAVPADLALMLVGDLEVGEVRESAADAPSASRILFQGESEFLQLLCGRIGDGGERLDQAPVKRGEVVADPLCSWRGLVGASRHWDAPG